MKFKLSHINNFTFAAVFFITLGLIGCGDQDTDAQQSIANPESGLRQSNPIPSIRVSNFIENTIVDGNLSFTHKITKKKLEVRPCNAKYQNACVPPKGAKLIGEETATVTIRSYQKTINSVLCAVLFEGPGYSFHVTWQEPGDTCSMGQPV